MRRYHVTTFGCQMNEHDAERVRGLLESAGLGETHDAADADLLVFNTCTIREKADSRLQAHLMNARALKERDPSKAVVVGGCWSESMGDRLFEEYPFVDFAFGPGNVDRLGAFVDDAASSGRGCRSRWAATPSARTASFPPCAAASAPAAPPTCWPRPSAWQPTA